MDFFSHNIIQQKECHWVHMLWVSLDLDKNLTNHFLDSFGLKFD